MVSSAGASEWTGFLSPWFLLFRRASASCRARLRSEGFKCCRFCSKTSSSSSLSSPWRSLECERVLDVDLDEALDGDCLSASEAGDLPLRSSFFDLGDEEKNEASSSTVVAAEAVEFDRLNLRRLSPVVCVYTEERLTVDFDFRLFIEPPKNSPIEAGRELKRFLDIASRPKIEAFDLAVGVPGLEALPVLNSNRPN
jgi:hypothetical protein